MFIEQQIGNTAYPLVTNRYNMWWTNYGKGGSAQTPFNQVDSGLEITNGLEQDVAKKYKGMVDAALKRKPGANVNVLWEKDPTGDVNARFTVKNLTDTPLTRMKQARVHLLVYEEAKLCDTSRFVRAGANSLLDEDLLPGETGTVEVTIPAAQFKGVIMSRTKVVGLFDYRPGGSTGSYELLNAAMGVEGRLSVPTEVPEPTATDTPEETPTPVPTSTPRPIVFPTNPPPPTAVPPTAVPVQKGIYLPVLKKSE